MAGGRNAFMPPGGIAPTPTPVGGMSGNPLAAPMPMGGRGVVPRGMAPLPTRMTPAGPRPPRQTDSMRDSPPGSFDPVHQQMYQAKTAFEQNMKAFDVLDRVRDELDELMNMGDMVRPEDVIKAAGRLVGHGFGAENLAQLLSDMPTVGGQGLASWIRMHDISVVKAETQLQQQTAAFQSRMGVTALRSLAASQVEDEGDLHAKAGTASRGSPIESQGQMTNSLGPGTTPPYSPAIAPASPIPSPDGGGMAGMPSDATSNGGGNGG
jgi:hypothetical protein